MLGIFFQVAGARRRQPQRIVKANDPGIVTGRAVDCPRTQAKDEAQHTGRHVDAFIPDVEIGRIANASYVGEKGLAVLVAGHALDQDGHLLILVDQTAVHPVVERIVIHHAGIDITDRLLKRLIALFRCALVGTEHALVFTSKGIAEIILEQ